MILVTGAAGMSGTELIKEFSARGIPGLMAMRSSSSRVAANRTSAVFQSRRSEVAAGCRFELPRLFNDITGHD
jgi:nucleoside-diphosphate-sugar epimerase